MMEPMRVRSQSSPAGPPLQEQPALFGAVLREVRHPHPVGRIGHKLRCTRVVGKQLRQVGLVTAMRIVAGVTGSLPAAGWLLRHDHSSTVPRPARGTGRNRTGENTGRPAGAGFPHCTWSASSHQARVARRPARLVRAQMT